MTLPVQKRRYTVEEYLRLERDALDKHEFHDGEILAMSGGSTAHSLITSNVGGELRNRLKGKRCRVYDSNLRVRVPGTPLYVYPDATIICGPTQLDPDDAKGETVMNPRVLVEVLSPSTEAYDRTTKFDRYREIESLQEYVLVSQDTPRIETYLRQSDGRWLLSTFAGLSAVVHLKSLEIELPLSEGYADVEFPPPSSSPQA